MYRPVYDQCQGFPKMAHVHHVQILVQNGTKYLQKFTQNANFQLFASRKSANLRQWAVRSGSIVFIITDKVKRDALMGDSSAVRDSNAHLKSKRRKTEVRCQPVPETLEPVHLQALPDHCFLEPSEFSKLYNLPCGTDCQSRQHRDTVFNIAFEVRDVGEALTRAATNGAKILCQTAVVSDTTNNGHVTIAAVQSCVGNVVHTLVDSSHYHGVFLPGFVSTRDHSVESRSDIPLANGELPACLTSHIDHVTFACPVGSSSEVLGWYERCFGMKRFLLTSEESESEGFIVRGKNVGLRLKAMEYWHCAETGLTLPAKQEKEDASWPRPPIAKFVIAEALPHQGPNQVERFLQEHGGAGIQHIGLHTHDILQAVSTLRKAGLNFIDPPPAYYTQVGKLTEISRIRDDLGLLQRLGILLDEETCHGDSDDKEGNQDGDKMHLRKTRSKYLMQTFTKPIFEQDTFFLEIIQRHGATGFGAGNIRALWRAVQSYMSLTTFDPCVEQRLCSDHFGRKLDPSVVTLIKVH
ncbi:4-hydroxyphenylpyruvate dioxygenase-like protein isoform X2 [Acanthaster planci]|uniref:4-hydroxyphenylpyruvate dioxygenase-like protein isoform X2 n=1 Tax=Acanthaster planci TaxID=133434 RepID=A0A8B7YM24_ACAPL|nr:4-hydroxyphenylpyruvate dioxygenase-like protein isoform X2 [Acanthaster planci]